MQHVLLDLRYALKSLVRAPMFATVAIGSLALGIGTNAAVFSVFNAILLRPLPYANPDRLVAVFETNPKQGATLMNVCPPDFLDWHRELTTIEKPAAYRGWEPNLTAVDVPERLAAMRVSGDFFDVLGTRPLAGRTLTMDDERSSTRVIVISQTLRRRLAARDQDVIGRTFLLNGESHEVVGVMPPSFQFPNQQTEVWAPLNLDRERNDLAEHSLRVVARLRAGSGLEAARAELTTRMARRGPENEGDSANLIPLRDWYVGAGSRRTLWVLLGAVGLLLLTACANVANLLLARGTGRARELMVRAAIGATRRRLLSQLAVESLVLSVVAGAVGLLFALWSADALIASLPMTSVYRLAPPTIDWRVLAYTMTVSTIAGLLFGATPALRYSRTQLNPAYASGRMSSRMSQRLLLVAQTALAVTLICGAGLLGRSFVNIWNIDPGFSPRDVMTARVSVPLSRGEVYSVGFFSDTLRTLSANPSVDAAGAVTFLPLSGEGSGGFITFEGRESMSAESGNRPGAGRLIVTPGYFGTLGIALKEGRLFTEDDRAGSAPVVIVNEAMVRQFWSGESPVGKRIKRGTPTAPFPWMTVVGVVADVRQFSLAERAGSMVYLPVTQTPASSMSLIVRSSLSDSAAALLIRSAVRSVDHDQPVGAIGALDDLVFGSVGARWLPLLWVSVFATLALLLAGLGVYGVVGYVVEQRRREFGIRMALGADRASLIRLAIRHGLYPAIAGAITGMIAASALVRANASFFPGAPPFDASAFIAAALLLVAIALLAAYPPARRIANDDAVIALKSE